MKKFFSVMLAVMMLLSAVLLAGCGKTDSQTDGSKIKIGGIGPLTGGAAAYGNAVKNGAQIAIDEINAKGDFSSSSTSRTTRTTLRSRSTHTTP